MYETIYFLPFQLHAFLQATPAQGQTCQFYPFTLNTEGFGCPGGEGTICFEVSGNNVYPISICDDYIVEIEYPTGSFIYTNLGDFSLHSFNQTTTVLRLIPFIVTDFNFFGCLDGVIQIPGTVFTLRIVHPNNPNDVITTQTFQLDNFITVGAPNTTTLLSDAILLAQLLPATLAATMTQKVRIEGTLVIDENYVFGFPSGGSMNNEIIMAPGAAIEVNSSYYLSFNKTRIHGCGNQWNRISVLPNAVLVVYNNTHISDAAVAIDLHDDSQLNMYRGFFSENDIAIGSFGTNQKNITLNFTSHNWGGNSVIRDGNEGIHFENVDLITLYGALVFINLNTGIHLDHTDFNGGYLSFYDCFTGVATVNHTDILDLWECYFKNGHVGVWNNGNTEMAVNYCVFIDGNYGIVRFGGNINDHAVVENTVFTCKEASISALIPPSSAEIQFNDLRSLNRNVFLSGYGTTPHAWAIQHNDVIENTNTVTGVNVHLNNTINARIFRNLLAVSLTDNFRVSGGYRNLIGYNMAYAFGEENNVNITGSPQSVVYCNILENLDQGIGLQFLNDCAGSDIRNNQMTGNTFNLGYGTAANVYANTGTQSFKGNVFDLSTPTNPKAINFSNTVVAQANRYLVGYLAVSQGDPYYPYFVASINDWFKKEEDVDYICPEGLTPPEDPKEKQLRAAAESGIGLMNAEIGNIYGDAVAFDAQLKLLRHLEELASTASLTDEQQEWRGYLSETAAGGFVAFEQAFASAVAVPESETEAAAEIAAGIRAGLAEIRDIEWFKVSETRDEITFQEEGLALRNSKTAELKTQISQLAELRKTATQNLQNALPELEALNNSIGGLYTIPAQNLKTINALLLKQFAADFAGYSESEAQTLSEIAAQCAGEGGEAVYTARSLWAMHTKDLSPQDYNDECIPATEAFLSRPTTPAALTSGDVLSLYPNPASGMTLATLPEDHGYLTLRISDLTGSIVRTYAVEEGQRQLHLDLTGLLPGLYFVSPEGKAGKAVKLIITR